MLLPAQGRAGLGRQGRAGQGSASLGSTMTSLQKNPSGRVMLNVLIPASGSKRHGVYTTMLCSLLLFTCQYSTEIIHGQQNSKVECL